MPYISTSRTRSRAPRYVTRLEASRGLAKDCVLAVVPDIGHINLVQNGSPLTFSGTFSRKRTRSRYGTLISDNSTSPYWEAVVNAGRNYTLAMFGTAETGTYSEMLNGYNAASDMCATLREWGSIQLVTFNTAAGVASGQPGSQSAEQQISGGLMVGTNFDDYAGNFTATCYGHKTVSSGNQFGTARDCYKVRHNLTFRTYFKTLWVAVWKRVLHREEVFAMAERAWLLFRDQSTFLMPYYSLGTGSTYTYAASGGCVIGGVAAKSRDKVNVSSGGIVSSGAAAKSRDKVNAASGGLSSAGAATTQLTTLTTHTYVGSGGITSSGVAIASYTAFTTSRNIQLSSDIFVIETRTAQWQTSSDTFINENVSTTSVWSATGSGGLTTSGVATTSLVSLLNKSWTGSGSISTSGIANVNTQKAFTAQGSLASAGIALISKVKAPTSVGGAITSGVATTSLSNASVKTYIGSGGLLTAGAAAKSRDKSFTVNGGLVTSGLATTQFTGTNIKTYIGSGGLLTAGAAAKSRDKSFTVNGGLVTSGLATTQFTGTNIKTYIGSGLITVLGAGLYARVKSFAVVGGVSTAGAATKSKDKNFTVNGGSTVSGAAQTQLTGANLNTYTGSGGLSASGVAIFVRIRAPIGVGGAVITGSAITLYQSNSVKAWIASGGLFTSGTAPRTKSKVVTAIGGAVTAGTALRSRDFSPTTSGVITASGVALREKLKVYQGYGELDVAGVAPTSQMTSEAILKLKWRKTVFSQVKTVKAKF